MFDLESFVCTSFIAFLFYGFVGWAYECTIWAKCEKKYFMNRGFLLGPLCPIYGLISFLDIALLRSIENPVLIFIVGAVVCSIFEFIVSYCLELIFHRRWWDYYAYPLNLDGRISVLSSAFFGLAGLFLLKIVHPWTMGKINSMPYENVRILALVLALVLLFDLIFTVIALLNKERLVGKVYQNIEDTLEMPFVGMNKVSDRIEGKIREKRQKKI